MTHDIDESVYLADRVIVLTHAPTHVKEIVGVPLPRPRDQIATKELPEFAHLRGARLPPDQARAGGDAGAGPGEPRFRLTEREERRWHESLSGGTAGHV